MQGSAVAADVGALHAGCPVAIGNLWDVTDRDIDRFAMAVLERWLPDQADDKGVCKAEPQEHGGEARQKPEGALCMSKSVAESRGVCRLPHLIGAAPVCYGVPTNVLLQLQ